MRVLREEGNAGLAGQSGGLGIPGLEVEAGMPTTASFLALGRPALGRYVVGALGLYGFVFVVCLVACRHGVSAIRVNEMEGNKAAVGWMGG